MPDWKRYVRTQLPSLKMEPAREVEIIEELAIQLEQAYQEALKGGCDEREAERIATAQLPDWQKLAVEIEQAQPPKHQAPPRFWQGMPADLRQAIRVLRKSPVFTLVAVATLAIGIGGCTAIFSLVEAVILHPIGYTDQQQLVMVWENQHRRGFHKNVVAMANYLDWKARNRVFSEMSPILSQIWNVTGTGTPVVLKGISVNDRFLPLLGVQPLIGRGFRPEEDRAGARNVVILSHRVWVERYGARGDAIGKSILLDDEPWTIIGILPANFPWLGQPLDVLTPTRLPNRDWRVRAGRFLRVAGRLKPGVSLSQARSEMNAIARQLEVEYPQFNKDWGVEIVPLADHFAGSAGVGLWVLMGAVGLLLLIACSNVANLMLARAVVREREMALRAALGATTQRLVRQLMTESIVLALIGGILGCAGAYAAIRLIQLYGPTDVSRLDSAGLNFQVALFALVASFVTGATFAIAPAVAAGRLHLGAILKDGGRGVLNTVRGERLRGIFVVAQVGFALVLLTAAILLTQSLYRLNSVPTGFDPHNVLTATVLVSGKVDSAKLSPLCAQIVDRLRTLPGIESAGFITFLPFTGMGAATDFKVAGAPPFPPGQAPVVDVRIVQPGYFETLRIPLLKGRLFNADDNRADTARYFIVNQALARQTFGTSNPIGQSLTVEMGDSKPGQIIGVVSDTKHMSLEGEIRPMVYYTQAQLPMSFGTFLIRTKGKPETMASAMVAAIQEVKKDQPVTELRTMEERIGLTLAQMRFQTALLSGFALIAIVLAVIGVYGVMSYSVEQRCHEIGVRLALGAEPQSLRRWITARGMRLAIGGVFLGLIVAVGSTRVLSSLLYAVKPNDPGTFALASLLLIIACLLASYVPARRATRVDPVIALRGE